MSEKALAQNENPDKKVNEIRQKYGIKVDKSSHKSTICDFEVEYKKITKPDRTELAIAFECEPDQVATSLKEVHSDTKYTYFTKISERLFLARNTTSETLQSQLLNNFKDFLSVAPELIFNPNLSIKIAQELDSATHTRILVQVKDYEDKNLTKYLKLLSSIETWSNPDVCIFTLLTFIKACHHLDLKSSNKFYFEFEKYIFDESLIKSLSDNKQITPELIEKIYIENDKNNYQINLFLALYPEAPGKILDNIVKKLDLTKLEKNKVNATLAANRNLIKLIITHRNTKSETLDLLWNFIKKTELSGYDVYFYENENTPVDILEADCEDKNDLWFKIKLVQNFSLSLEKRRQYLKEVLEGYQSSKKSEEGCDYEIDSAVKVRSEIIKETLDITYENGTEYLLFNTLPTDQNTPAELVSDILNFMGAIPQNQKEIAYIINRNPNLIVDENDQIIDQTSNKVLYTFPLSRDNITLILTHKNKNEEARSYTKLESSKVLKILNYWENILSNQNIRTLLEKLSLNQEIFNKLEELIETNYKTTATLSHEPITAYILLVDRVKLYPIQNFNKKTITNRISALYNECIKLKSSENSYYDVLLTEHFLKLASSPYCSRQTLVEILKDNSYGLQILEKFIKQGVELAGTELPAPNLRVLYNAIISNDKTKNFNPSFFIKSINTPFDILEDIYQAGDGKVKKAIIKEFTDSQRLTPQYQQTRAYKLPLAIMQDILKNEDIGNPYFYKRRNSFLNNDRFGQIRLALGSGDKNYADIIGIEKYFDTALELLKILETEKYPSSGSNIVLFEKDKKLKIIDLLSFSNSNGILYTISKIQQYFLNLSANILEKFTNRDMVKLRSVLKSFADVEVTLTDHRYDPESIEPECFMLDFCTYLPFDEKEIKKSEYESLIKENKILLNFIELETSPHRFRFNFSINIYKDRLNVNETKEEEIRRCEALIQDFIKPIQVLFSKFQKEIESEKEDYNQLMEKQEYRKILQDLDKESIKAQELQERLDKQYQEDYNDALNELSDYSKQLQECEERQQELINLFIKQLDYDEEKTHTNTNTNTNIDPAKPLDPLSTFSIQPNHDVTSIVLSRPKLTIDNPNDIAELAKFDAQLNQITIDTLLDDITLKLKNNSLNITKNKLKKIKKDHIDKVSSLTSKMQKNRNLSPEEQKIKIKELMNIYKQNINTNEIFLKSQATYLELLSSINDQEAATKRKRLIRVIRMNFESNKALDNLVISDKLTPETEPILKELQSNILTIHKYLNLKFENYNKKLPLDYQFIYGSDPTIDLNTGLELDQGKLGIFQFCTILKNIYQNFLIKSKTLDFPTKLKDEIETDLFRLNLLLESL